MFQLQRHYGHIKQPHCILSDFVKRKHLTQPITRSLAGAGYTRQWLSIFEPQPQMGQLHSMSWMFQLPLRSQLGHSISFRSATALQKLIFNCFLQFQHRSFILSNIGDDSLQMNLLGPTSSRQSAGLPSDTVRQVNRCCGPQLIQLCPSGILTLI